jgi:putative GTP pyrophosphokinase
MLSKTQITALGERLRGDGISEADLRMLDEYRRTFEEAINAVMHDLQTVFQLQAAARPAKSTEAIVAKLKRETIRLPQMQDIAGCRVVVNSMSSQRDLVKSLLEHFVATQVHYRTDDPSHGYRAVHVIVSTSSGLVEIQVRTQLQHLWAQLSEAVADRWGAEIKYGGGDAEGVRLLNEYSVLIAEYEQLEMVVAPSVLSDLFGVNSQRLNEIRAGGLKLSRALQTAIAQIESLKQSDT